MPTLCLYVCIKIHLFLFIYLLFVKQGEKQPANLERLREMRVSGPPPIEVANSATRRIAAVTSHLAETVVEPARELPVLTRCDVLVVGGGPAGLSAALGAKRAGADTVLMERFGCFGGVITTVGMETLGWYRYEGTVDTEGIGREMERAAERMGGELKARLVQSTFPSCCCSKVLT